MTGVQGNLDKYKPPMMELTQRTLLELLEKPSTRNSDLQTVILRDPGAAVAVFSRLHEIAPSAMDDVTDIQHALGMLGMKAFESLVKSYPTLSAERKNSSASTCFLFSQLAHAAIYAMAIARVAKQTSPEQLATAALLQDAAILALWQKEPDSALRATNATKEGVSPEIAFYAELRANINEVNQAVANAWGLPSLARETMNNWSAFSPKPLLVNLVTALARSTAANWHSEETETAIELLEGYLPKTISNPTGWLMQNAVDAAHQLSDLDYPLSVYTRLYIPGEPDDSDLPPWPSKKKPAAAPLDINKIIGGYMKRMRKDTASQRIIFAMLTPDRSALKTRLALGGGKTDSIRHFSISNKQKNLFSILMKKPQALWFNDENKARYEAHIPGDHKNTFSSQGFFAMSLFINEKPIGLMVADNAEDDPANEQNYRYFRKYCKKISQTLTDAVTG